MSRLIVTNREPSHPAMLFKGRGQGICKVADLAPGESWTSEDGEREEDYWSDTGRVDFEEIEG